MQDNIDKANLGNAKTDGFEKDIGLKDSQYSLILILFYIPYGECKCINFQSAVLTMSHRYPQHSSNYSRQEIQSHCCDPMSHVLLGNNSGYYCGSSQLWRYPSSSNMSWGR
jgi:hypothetical protein